MEEEKEIKILYDLVLPEEWPQEVTILDEAGHQSLWKMLTAMMKACKWFSLELIKNPSILLGVQFSPTILADIINSRLSWQLAMSSDGKQLAIAREDCIELRSVLDDFEVARMSFKVSKDIQPQWRKMAWNHNGNTLIYANSKGEVTAFINFGKMTSKLVESSSPSSGSDVSLLNMAISGLVFIHREGRGEEERGAYKSELLVIVGYNGLITTFQSSVNGYDQLHSISMLSYFPCGIGAVDYTSVYNLLILAGWVDTTDQQNTSPVVSWRLTDTHPYWEPPPGQQIQKLSRGNTFKQLMAKKIPNPDSLFTVSVNPSGRVIAGISLSGDLSLWDLPSCRLRTKWTTDELFSSVQAQQANTQNAKGPLIPLEVQWWSDQAIILADSHHNVTVFSTGTLSNLLGEYSEPGASVTPACHGQFLMLECNSQEQWVKRDRLLPSLSEMEESEGEEDGSDGEKESRTDLEPKSLNSKISIVMKKLLYFVTEMEQFKPPTQKLKKRITQYGLVCLKSMSPEECYDRKMKNEEYGEALALAKRYGLDCDLVYQHQWDKCPVVTKATINDYLARISKRSWVLRECLRCVANDFLTMTELLLFGKQCTAYKKLFSVDDKGHEEEMEDIDVSVTNETPVDDIVTLISKLGSLSEDQIFLCQCRHSLLQYIDRLNTYEIILGGAAATFELYDARFFEKFREQNLVKAAIEYARDGNYCAVEALFNRHSDTVLPHRLAILANFPETLDPSLYSYLLPEINDSDGAMEEWEGEEVRKRDWVEHPAIRKLYSFNRQTSSGDFIYEEQPDLKKYLVSPVSCDLLTMWYSERSNDIEEYSGRADNALSIVKIGIDNGIEGLEDLYHHLKTLNILIYHCNVDVRLSLSKVKQMSHLDIVQLIMKDIDEKDFVAHFNRYCMPYISRLKQTDQSSAIRLLEEFMTIVSKNDLRPCVGILKEFKHSDPKIASFQLMPEERIKIGLTSILACERSDQLKEADAILECLPTKKGSSLEKLHCEVDQLENYLFAADILKQYDVLKPVHFFKTIQGNSQEAEKLIIRLTRVASRKTPALDDNGWRRLLNDIITLKTRIFNTLSKDLCYKIFAESVLCSGDLNNIQMASQIIRPTPSTTMPFDNESPSQGINYLLPYDTSVEVIVTATREYINSATSPKDKEVELAKLCVSLIKANPLPAKLQSELNLILALDILNEFGITLLPINVRLCENKLDLIRQVLDSSATAYKRHDKILHLSYLLGHSSEPDCSLDDLLIAPTSLSEGRGYTLVVIALAAIQSADYSLAYKTCAALMSTRFEHAWEVCKQLGTDDKYTDKELKLDLLNFSLCYCPVEEIQNILREKKVLNAKILLDQCHHLNDMDKGTVKQIVGIGSSTLHNLVSQGASHLVRQKQSSNPPKIYGESHKESLNLCLESVQRLIKEKEPKIRFNAPLPILYHPFYPTNQKESKQLRSYSSWRESVNTLDIVLHQTLLSVGRSLCSLDDTFMQQDSMLQLSLQLLANELLYKDSHFAIACLMSMNPDDFDNLCSLCPSLCRLSHQIPVFICCLHIYLQFTDSTDHRCHPYNYSPFTVIDHVSSHIDSLRQLQDVNLFVNLFSKYNESLNVHLESQTLHSLKKNIDVDLFFAERNYRKKTILSLARSESTEAFEISKYLANRFDLSQWDVNITQLGWFMTESGLSAEDINHRVTEYKIMDVLLSEPQKTADEFTKRIYPALPSTRYSLLYEYFTYLQWISNKGATINDNVSVETHLILLKQLKKLLRDVSYHQLMDGTDPLRVLIPAIWDHNVDQIAKLAYSIPIEGGKYLSSAMVYKAFIVKKFRQEIDSSESDTVNILRTRISESKEYIAMLDSNQFELLVLELLFSYQAQKFSLDVRIIVLKIFIDMCNQRKGGNKKEAPSFRKLSAELNLYRRHIESLKESEICHCPVGIDKDKWNEIVNEYDLSLAQTEKVSDLALRACALGVPVLHIKSLLTTSNNVKPHTLTVKCIVEQALVNILPSEDLTASIDKVSSAIEPILVSVAKHEKEVDQCLVSSANVLDVLRPICSSPKHSPELKRTLLHLMNKYLSLSLENFSLLLLYQTQSIIAEHFSDVQVAVEQVSTDKEQSNLFSCLLQQSTTIEQLNSLVSLLQTWPNTNTSLKKCWHNLLVALAQHKDDSSGRKLIKLRIAMDEFDPEVDTEMFHSLLHKDMKSALQLGLITTKTTLISELLKKVTFDELKQIVDDFTLEIVFFKQKLPLIVTTPLYQLVYNYLMQASFTADYQEIISGMQNAIQPSIRIVQAARSLNDSGFVLEAGSLILLLQNAHTVVRNVSAAFTLANKLFNDN